MRRVRIFWWLSNSGVSCVLAGTIRAVVIQPDDLADIRVKQIIGDDQRVDGGRTGCANWQGLMAHQRAHVLPT